MECIECIVGGAHGMGSQYKVHANVHGAHKRISASYILFCLPTIYRTYSNGYMVGLWVMMCVCDDNLM